MANGWGEWGTGVSKLNESAGYHLFFCPPVPIPTYRHLLGPTEELEMRHCSSLSLKNCGELHVHVCENVTGMYFILVGKNEVHTIWCADGSTG